MDKTRQDLELVVLWDMTRSRASTLRGGRRQAEIRELVHSCFQTSLVRRVVDDGQHSRSRARHRHERMLFCCFIFFFLISTTLFFFF